jgi:sRNA-binding protein
MKDETGTGQDPLPGGGQASGTGKGTSAETTKTFTEEQVKQAVEKAVSDAESKKGRDWQGLSAKAARVDELEEDVGRLSSQLQTFQEKQLEAIRDDPDALRQYQARQEAQRILDEANAERRKAKQEREQNQVDLDAMHKWRTERLAAEIAGKYKGVEPGVLLAVTDGTAEKMEALAKVLGKPKEAKPLEGDQEQEQPDFDQGGTSGTGLRGIEALERANRDFAEGKISEKQLKELAQQVK